MAVTYLVEIDWANTGVWTDITTYCEGFSISRGRQRPTDTISPGGCSFTLWNDAGRFTPGLASGPNYPNVKLNRPIRVSVLSGATRSYLFSGTVDVWGATWAGGVLPMCTVTATDAFKGLARRTAQSYYGEVVNSLAPIAYYPLSEAVDSTSFGNAATASPQPPAQLRSSKYGPGTLTAGNGAGWMPGAPANTYLIGTRTGTAGGTQGFTVVQLAGGAVAGGPSIPLSGPFTIGLWFNTAASLSGGQTLVYSRAGVGIDPSAGAIASQLIIGTNPVGIISATITTGGAASSVISSAVYVPGQWTYVLASLAADRRTMTLTINGTATTTTVAGAAFAPFAPQTWLVAGGQLDLYGSSTSGLNGTSLASLELYPTALTLAQCATLYNAGAHGPVSDTGSNVATLAALAGLTTSCDTGNTLTTAPLDITGSTYLAAMQEWETTEAGALFMRGDGVLRFQNRAARVDQGSTFTLDASHQEIGADFQAGVDDTGLFNDYATTRPGGPVARAQDPTSIADNGIYTNAPTDSGALMLYVTTDAEVTDRANWTVAQYGEPQVRAPSVTVDLLRAPDLWPTVQAVDIGTRFTVVNLPSSAPAASMILEVEGIAWNVDIPSDITTLTMNTSPADVQTYLTLDDNTYGLLDSNALFY